MDEIGSLSRIKSCPELKAVAGFKPVAVIHDAHFRELPGLPVVIEISVRGELMASV